MLFSSHLAFLLALLLGETTVEVVDFGLGFLVLCSKLIKCCFVLVKRGFILRPCFFKLAYSFLVDSLKVLSQLFNLDAFLVGVVLKEIVQHALRKQLGEDEVLFL